MPVYQVQAGMIVEPNQVCHSAQQEDDLGSGSATTCASRKDSWKSLLMRSCVVGSSGRAAKRRCAVGARWRRRTRVAGAAGGVTFAQCEASAKIVCPPPLLPQVK